MNLRLLIQNISLSFFVSISGLIPQAAYAEMTSEPLTYHSSCGDKLSYEWALTELETRPELDNNTRSKISAYIQAYGLVLQMRIASQNNDLHKQKRFLEEIKSLCEDVRKN